MNPDMDFHEVGTGLANMMFVIGFLIVALIAFGIRDTSENRKDDDRD